MKKITKGIAVGLISMMLCVGTVYAAYLVWREATHTTVKEPVTVVWETKLPTDTFPNQTYNFGVCLQNGWVDSNGTQNVGVKVTKSDNLTAGSIGSRDGKTIVWNDLNTFTLANGIGDCIRGQVNTPSDMTPGDAWVNVDVTRE